MTFIQMSYHDWENKFKPITKPGTDHIAFDTHYDDELLKAQPNSRIWTLVACPSEECVIVNGKWHINRMEYYITELPHDERDEYNIE